MPWWGWLIAVGGTVLILWWVLFLIAALKIWRKVDNEWENDQW